MTGVFVVEVGGSLLLQPLMNTKLQRKSFTPRRKDEDAKAQSGPDLSLRLCVKFSLDFFVMVILDGSSFVGFLGQRFAGHTILTFNPPAQIHKLAPLRTEGTKRIFFPLD